MSYVECCWARLTCLCGAVSFDISASSTSTMYVCFWSECLHHTLAMAVHCP